MKVIAIWQLTSPSFYLHVFTYYPNPTPRKSTFKELMALLGILLKSAFLFSTEWRTFVMTCILNRMKTDSLWLTQHWSLQVSFLEFWRCSNRRRIWVRCRWCPGGGWQCLLWHWISLVYQFQLQVAKRGERQNNAIKIPNLYPCHLLRNVHL